MQKLLQRISHRPKSVYTLYARCLSSNHKIPKFSPIGSIFMFVMTCLCSSYTVLPIDNLKEKNVQLSHLPGKHSKKISLTSIVPTGIDLLYTTTGSIPGLTDKRMPRRFSIDTVTSLTIRLIRNGKSTDSIYCGTYVVGFSSSLPISCIIIPEPDLFDPVQGIYVGGTTAEGQNFGNCWKNIEKRAFFEYFDRDVNAIAQNCGLKIFGGLTRMNPEKSLRVIARKKYGKGRFKYKVFPTKDISNFNSLILRTSGNDYNGTRFLDMMLSSAVKDMGIDYMGYQPSVLFVNGKYWGIHNLREKINEDYLEKNHGANPDETDILFDIAWVQYGTAKKYNELIGYADSYGPKSPDLLDSLSKRMDIDNFFKYSLFQIHIVNIDSYGNCRYWRAGNLDGKFRWIFYDGDLSFYHSNFDFLAKKISPVQTDWYNPTGSTILLRKLLSNRALRDKFITEYCYQLSTILSGDSLKSRILEFKKLLEPEMNRHLKRKGFNQSKSIWESRVNGLIEFAKNREKSAYEHLKNNFQLGNTFELKITSKDTDPKYTVCLNENPILKYPYQGKYFSDVDVTLRIQDIDPEWEFSQWSDGIKDPMRIIRHSQNSTCLVQPEFTKRTNSSLDNTSTIRAVGLGGLQGLKFVITHTSSDGLNPTSFRLLIGKLDTMMEMKNGTNIICSDTALFKNTIPSIKGTFIQCNSLKAIKNNHIYKVVLLDPHGDIVDRSIIRPQNSLNMPFYVRNGDDLVGSVVIPSMQELNSYSKGSIGGFRLLSIVASISILSLALFVLIRFKKTSTKANPITVS